MKFWWELHFNSKIRLQLRNPQSIPIIIINFNQLFYLKKLVDFLILRNFENIVIIDNHSRYPPLLEYYETLPTNVIVERMTENLGHMVFFENAELQKKYGRGFYVVTDPDINFYPDYPVDFMTKMLKLLIRYKLEVTKVGLALNLDDIPDHFTLKKKVLNWEKRFWENEVMKDVYKAIIDTTFAMYLPGFPQKFKTNGFYSALRIGGRYKVQHGGWYVNHKDLTAEQKFYQSTCMDISSWMVDEEGNLFEKSRRKY